MKIFYGQLDIAWEDKRANYKKVRALLESAAAPPESLVVLPEMFSTGFSMNVAGIREGAPSETERFLESVAREFRVFVLGGLVTPGKDGRGRNEAVVFHPDGKLLARYCKIHPFTFGGETQHYEAGSEIALFDWAGFNVAPFVCYDLRFPEIFRIGAKRGAQLFAVIANWPSKRMNHWITLLQARAIENQAYVVGVNRCGNDPKLSYPGRSLIIDPLGEIIADAGTGEAMAGAEVDPARIKAWRSEFPALPDMRREFVKE